MSAGAYVSNSMLNAYMMQAIVLPYYTYSLIGSTRVASHHAHIDMFFGPYRYPFGFLGPGYGEATAAQQHRCVK